MASTYFNLLEQKEVLSVYIKKGFNFCSLQRIFLVHQKEKIHQYDRRFLVLEPKD